MWVHGTRLGGELWEQARQRGYTSEQVESMAWYVTARGTLSDRHKPRQGGLDDGDVQTILTALGYLRRCPHLDLINGMTPQDVDATIERVRNELFGDGETGQGNGVED